MRDERRLFGVSGETVGALGELLGSSILVLRLLYLVTPEELAKKAVLEERLALLRLGERNYLLLAAVSFIQRWGKGLGAWS